MRRKDSKQETDNHSGPEKTGQAQAAKRSQSKSGPGEVGKPEAPATYSDYFNKPIVHVLLIVVLTLIAYSNTFHVPFQFDDRKEILENHAIKNLAYFTNLSTQNTRYVGYFTFAVNYALHGLNVVGYHIFNLAIHIFNALFLYWFIILSFRTPALKESAHQDSVKLIALFTALLFACHPIQTQAVTYIVQRLASLATMFYLFSIVFYVNARLSMQDTQPKSKSLLWYGASLFSAVLAMKTKELAFTLPVVITLYEFMFFEAGIKKRILYLLPLLLTMLIIPLSLISISKPIGDVIGDVSHAARMQTQMSRWDYLFTEFRVIVTYVRLLFLPVNQTLDYDYPIFRSLFDPGVFLSFLFLLSILILGIYLFYRHKNTLPHSKLISFGIFWFFITLSVESSVIPIPDVIFEHRLYLPSVGFFIALTTFIFWVRNRLKAVISVAGRAVIPMLIGTVLVLSGAAYSRNSVWMNRIGFWEDVVKKSPKKARPHSILGIAYSEKGRFEEAIRENQTAIKLDPYYTYAYINLGALYGSQGHFEEAIREFKTAIKLNPNHVEAHNNLGVAYYKKGHFEEAERELLAAIKLNPRRADAHMNLGALYGAQGRFEEAIRETQTALRLNPDYVEAYRNLEALHNKRSRSGAQ